MKAIAFIAALLCLTPAWAADINAGAPTIAVPVDVELVLAVDVSRSMDADEAALQRAGYVDAIRHPDFIRAIKLGANGRIALTYFEWAGDVREESVVPWQVIDSPESAAAFADRIVERNYGGFRGTSISSALIFGTAMIARRRLPGGAPGHRCLGRRPQQYRGAGAGGARRRGVGGDHRQRPADPDPAVADLHPSRPITTRECVIGGPGSFVLPIYASSEFATAIRRKLILEVSGDMPSPGIVLAAATGAIDCLKGERDRRLYSDPYFPELDK